MLLNFEPRHDTNNLSSWILLLICSHHIIFTKNGRVYRKIIYQTSVYKMGADRRCCLYRILYDIDVNGDRYLTLGGMAWPYPLYHYRGIST